VKAVSAVRKQQHIEYRVPATALLWLSVHAGGQASQAALDACAPIWSGSYRHWQQLLFQSYISHCRGASCVSLIRWRCQRWRTSFFWPRPEIYQPAYWQAASIAIGSGDNISLFI